MSVRTSGGVLNTAVGSTRLTTRPTHVEHPRHGRLLPRVLVRWRLVREPMTDVDFYDPDEFGWVDPEYTVDDLAWFAQQETREQMHEQGFDDAA